MNPQRATHFTTALRFTFRIAVGLALAVASAAAQPETPRAETAIRMGFSSAIFIGYNADDVRQSVKIISDTFTQEHGINADTTPYIYDNADEAARVLEQREIGGVNMTLSEYWLIRHRAGLDLFCTYIRNHSSGESYVLLVREGGPVKALADLKGKRLTLFSHPSMDLATSWLDVELAKAELPATTKLLHDISTSNKPAKAVLPVFFGQVDACLTTRRSYDTMVELNPQVGRQLRILAASPAYIPILYGFRSDLTPEIKKKAIESLTSMHQTVSGLQTLSLFQIDQIAECPASDFAPSLALLDEHARLYPKTASAAVPTPPVVVTPSP